MNAVESLMTGLIDYAGLFPPAGLSMEDAVGNYAKYRSGDHGWALGKFIVPVVALQEFDEVAGHWLESASASRSERDWPVAILAAANQMEYLTPIPNIQQSITLREAGFRVECIEWRVDTPEQIPRAMRVSAPDLTAYFEVPAWEDASEWVEAVSSNGARAKIRTGGVAAEAFPSTAELARFLSSCARAKVGFKATAGLHHALRSVHPFTDEPNSVRGKMHGFLNVFLAAALAWLSDGQADLASTLEAESASQFRMEPNTLHWLDYSVTSDQLAIVRQNFAFSFGSCSFEEPLNDLKVLGWL
jgi:hypothetical protein